MSPPDLRAFGERTLSREGARAYLDAPITDAERDSAVELIAWFRRRYPTALARLAYARRAYSRWQATRGRAPAR